MEKPVWKVGRGRGRGAQKQKTQEPSKDHQQGQGGRDAIYKMLQVP